MLNPTFMSCILSLLLSELWIFRAVLVCCRRKRPMSAEKLRIAVEIRELWPFALCEFGKRCWAVQEQNLLNEWKSLLGTCPLRVYFETWILQAHEGLWGVSGLVAADSFFVFLFSSWLLWIVFDTLDIFYNICAEAAMLFSPLSLAEKKAENCSSFTHRLLLRS